MTHDNFYDILFEPVKIGPKTTKNRFFQVPHCSGMGYMLPKTLAAMREVKAEGGWGVVCTEYCSIHPTSDDTPYPHATLWDEEDIKNQALMVEKVHRHGALAGVQLWHGGKSVANLLSREVPLGVMSYPTSAFNHPVQSKPMDKKDIRELRRWQVEGARRAVRAGFDIIYVYATHSYLLNQFLSRERNQRSDEYGGSLENRVRLIREMIEDTKEEVGDGCAVAVRFSADTQRSHNGVIDNQEQREMMEMLADLPDLWDINISDYSREMGSSRFIKEAALEDYVSYVKKITNKPVVSVGRFTSPDTMVRQIRKGFIDLIGAARPSIADPFLPQKIQEGRFEDIRECIGCNTCFATDNRGAPIRCTQNPTMGEEWRRGWHPEIIPPKKSDDKILVVGAGPAGLEAARALGRRGYPVTLAEGTDELGGRVLAESRLPGLSEWIRVRDYRIQQIKGMRNLEVFRASQLTVENILEFDFDRVVLATGSNWRRDGIGRWHATPVPGFDDQSVFTPDDIMKGIGPKGPVIVFDDDHYYMGAVIAEKLRDEGLEVSLVTPEGVVGFWSLHTVEQERAQKRLLDLGVKIFTSNVINGFDGESAEISCVYTETSFRQPASSIVTITARIPNDELYRQLQENSNAGNIKSVFHIGDCMAPGTIAAAVYAGHRLAREMDSSKTGDVPFRRERVTV
jgi:dimethylamine/trimethylamine dehydrogenase